MVARSDGAYPDSGEARGFLPHQQEDGLPHRLPREDELGGEVEVVADLLRPAAGPGHN